MFRQAEPHLRLAVRAVYSVTSDAQARMAMQQDQPIEVLEAELDRLRNSCQHLQRSNHELQQALNLDGPDPEFEEAIEVSARTGN